MANTKLTFWLHPLHKHKLSNTYANSCLWLTSENGTVRGTEREAIEQLQKQYPAHSIQRNYSKERRY